MLIIVPIVVVVVGGEIVVVVEVAVLCVAVAVHAPAIDESWRRSVVVRRRSSGWSPKARMRSVGRSTEVAVERAAISRSVAVSSSSGRSVDWRRVCLGRW